MKENITYDLILKNGEAVLPNGSKEKLDIGIKNGLISKLGDLSNSSYKKMINISKLIVLPGAIDTQVHFREPGLIQKEDIYHGTKGAVLGGITSIFEMPNTDPPTINKKELNVKIKIAEKKAFCNFSFFAGAAKKNIKDLANLEKISGCCGVKIFMGSSTGDLLVEDDESLRNILLSVNRRVAVHSEDEYRLRERKSILERDNVTVFDHPIWRDVTTACNSTKRLLKIAKDVKKHVHVLHISTADEIELIRKFKDIASCEVTPQHLFFTSPECYERLGSLAQMNPPIRDKYHNEGLWKGIQNKTVDVIGSDHAPHTLEQKQKSYPKSPSGMTGVQTLLPIMLNFVNQKKISLAHLVKLTSENPCKIYKIKNKGFIKEGFDADLTIVDLKKEFVITNNWIASKCGWTPYDQIKIKGIPTSTIVKGNLVMRENEVISHPKGSRVLFS